MKKVGLVSVRNYNYGSILQAYALQQELFAAGIDNELIYYKKRNVVKQALRIFNLPLLMAKTKDVWRVIEGKTNPKLKPIISGRNRAFSNFLKDNFVFTPCLSGKKQLVDYTKKFDAFILGSDQVWNPMLLGGDYYTLTWVDSRRPKVTYASSFGVSEIPASQVKKTKEYLSRFSMISVREKQGAEIVEKLTGKKAEVCCDPTVLTDRKRWDGIYEGVTQNNPLFLRFFSENALTDYKNSFLYTYNTVGSMEEALIFAMLLSMSSIFILMMGNKRNKYLLYIVFGIAMFFTNKRSALLIGMILVMFYSFIIDVLTWYQPIFIISFIIALSNWNIKEAKKECEYTR